MWALAKSLPLLGGYRYHQGSENPLASEHVSCLHLKILQEDRSRNHCQLRRGSRWSTTSKDLQTHLQALKALISGALKRTQDTSAMVLPSDLKCELRGLPVALLVHFT